MKIIRAILFVALGLAVSTGQVFAQTETGRISGTVTDPQGGVVPGVTVTSTSVGTGAMRTTVTDAGAATAADTTTRLGRGAVFDGRFMVLGAVRDAFSSIAVIG